MPDTVAASPRADDRLEVRLAIAFITAEREDRRRGGFARIKPAQRSPNEPQHGPDRTMADRARHDVAGGGEPPDRLFPWGNTLSEPHEPRRPCGQEPRGHVRRDRRTKDVSRPAEDESHTGGHAPATRALHNDVP